MMSKNGRRKMEEHKNGHGLVAGKTQEYRLEDLLELPNDKEVVAGFEEEDESLKVISIGIRDFTFSRD
jgi:hypothetical protein